MPSSQKRLKSKVSQCVDILDRGFVFPEPFLVGSGDILQSGLVIGSGKSTIDAAKFLIQEGNTVRFIYRSACAYVRWGFNSPLSSILQWVHPFIHFTMLDESVTPEDWKYDSGSSLQ